VKKSEALAVGMGGLFPRRRHHHVACRQPRERKSEREDEGKERDGDDVAR
jgi:hypothetical protein